MLRQAAEIKIFFRSNQLSYGLSTTTITTTPIEDISKQFNGTQLPSESNTMYLIHKNITEIVEALDLEVVYVTIVVLIGST